MEEIKPYIRNRANRIKEKDSLFRKILIWAKKLKAVNLLGGKCEICGETKLWTLCFHHKDPNEKEESIGTLKGSKVRFTDLMEEINKCQLLCQNCHREVHTEINNINERQRLNKYICLEYKNQICCETCGYDKCNSALEFHHINPLEKETKISKFINNHSWKTISDITIEAKKELDKCIVVCRNCHQTLHYDMDFFKNNFTEIEQKSKTLLDKTIVDRQKVIEMGKLGFNRFEISKKLNCSPGRVWEILKSNGLTTPPRIIDKKIVIDLYESGVRICDIVRTTSYSESSVSIIIRKYKHAMHTMPNKHNSQ